MDPDSDPTRAPRRSDYRPSRRRLLLYSGVASVVFVGATASGSTSVKAQARDAEDLVSSSAAPSASGAASPTPSPAPFVAAASEATEAAVEPAAAPSVDRDALLAEAMESVTVEAGAEVSVAVLDLESGESAAYGDGRFDTASIVKVDILASLLLQAQDTGRRLTAQEKAYATAMIQNSDNASATALWYAIGQAKGLHAANARFGLSHTEGGDGALWGLTQTTAADQLALLRQVFGSGDRDGDGDRSALGAASREYLQGLMGGIAVGQDWGVSAAGGEFALKNGWLPRTATGLWDVNSIGRVSVGVDGREYLVAVLSHGNSTKVKGVSLVETVAKAAVGLFADA
ncbi:serine hydrolase [Streptomyces sp. 2A115]|uniref:serine hydrolase n=1 Tax=Streptomyces sp. 2A115 TaxID=3457439 RepID=UPI003FCF303E